MVSRDIQCGSCTVRGGDVRCYLYKGRYEGTVQITFIHRCDDCAKNLSHWETANIEFR